MSSEIGASTRQRSVGVKIKDKNITACLHCLLPRKLFIPPTHHHDLPHRRSAVLVFPEWDGATCVFLFPLLVSDAVLLVLFTFATSLSFVGRILDKM